MWNTPTWRQYVTAARKHAGLSRAELAGAMGTGRTTIYKWETTDQRPERAEVVVRFAAAVGVDLDEALAAAGFRPAVSPPDRPARQDPPPDPDVEAIRRRLEDPNVPEDAKRLIRAQIRYLDDLLSRAIEPKPS